MSAYATTQPIPGHGFGLLDTFIEELAARVAQHLAAESATAVAGSDDWLDSRHAAEYLGVHRDTVRKLAAERAIPTERDGPRCKLYFRKSDLDVWRQSGGRPRHLAVAA